MSHSGCDQTPGLPPAVVPSRAAGSAERVTHENLRTALSHLSDSATRAGDAEISTAVALLVDLLDVAECLQQDPATSGEDREIRNFFEARALPAVAGALQTGAPETGAPQTEPGGSDALRILQQEISDRWGEMLLLLHDGEPQSARTSPLTFPVSDQDLWETLSRPSDADHGEVEDAVGPRSQVSIGEILASLGEPSKPSPAPMSTAAAGGPAAPSSRDRVIVGAPQLPRTPSAVERSPAAASCDSHDPPSPLRCAGRNPAGGPFSEEIRSEMPLPPQLTEQIEDPEMIAAYCDDAQQCLAEMEACLLNLESGQATSDALRHFCRQLHTLKGASGTVGLSQLASYLHELENYVEAKVTTPAGPDVEMLLKGVDVVRHQIAMLSPSGGSGIAHPIPTPGGGAAAPQRDSAGARGELVAPTDSGTVSAGLPAGDGEQFVRIEASRLDRLMDLLAELVMLRNRRDTYVRSLRTVHDELNYCSARTRSLNAAIDSHDTGLRLTDLPGDDSGGELSAQRASLTSTARLLSRSLAELSNDVTELGRSLHDVCEPLSEDNSAVSHLIGRFRQELMELRRLPLAGLFQRLQRTVRDAARAEGKQVQLIVEGQGARAERTLQERLFEPLMHLVRNGVSHGIELSTDRLAAGKPPSGRITLETWSDAASLFIEVRDDGRGLNDEVLEARGRELGLLPAGQSVSRERLWKLIFQPGFSTRAKVSQISGRGVGMDVVDSWIRRLRGRIDVESVLGQGTTFRLQIPVRSAIEHAMIVRTGGQLFALPMQSVNGTSDPQLQPESPAGDRTGGTPREAGSSSGGHLAQLLGMGETHSLRPCYLSLRDTTERDGVRGTEPAGTQVRTMSIAVDGVVGVEEVVVRSLPPLLQSHELFAGVTLSGRAETVLLLDVPRLIDLGTLFRFDASRSALGRNIPHRPGETSGSQTRVLIADDSVTIRRSLSRRLKAAGVLTSEASNGVDALKLLRCGGISAVVTDIDMPRMNGLELLQEIRRQRQFQAIPVIVFTSRDDLPTITQLKDSGAAGVLSKPVTEDTITAILDCVEKLRTGVG